MTDVFGRIQNAHGIKVWSMQADGFHEKIALWQNKCYPWQLMIVLSCYNQVNNMLMQKFDQNWIAKELTFDYVCLCMHTGNNFFIQ